jgi:hypothetical protein
MKVGHNDLCPCGSGKKYKKCCLAKGTVVPAEDLAYKRLSKAYQDLDVKIEAFFVERFDADEIGEGLEEFFCWLHEEDNFDFQEMLRIHQDIYHPWMLYNWDCRSDEDIPDDEDDEDETISVAEVFLLENYQKLTRLEHRLIRALSRKTYCFWEVKRIVSGRSIDLQNIMTGEALTVQERTASEYVQSGDIVFARPVEIEGVGMLAGIAQIRIPPVMKPSLIEFRKVIREEENSSITDETVVAWDMVIREAYFSIHNQLHTPPKLQNTDGEPLEFHKLIFDIKDSETAFVKLSPLCSDTSAASLRETAETDGDNRIRKIKFSWIPKEKEEQNQLSSIVLGTIEIDIGRLTVEVNSASRARQIKEEIEIRLGDGAQFKIDAIEDSEAKMRSFNGDAFDPNGFRKDQADLMALPEVQQHLEEMILDHWDEWIDLEIPALGNKTPREAVKTEDGKEAVEALLKDVENIQAQDPIMTALQKKGVGIVRKELGL